jgi:serine protease DegQ
VVSVEPNSPALRSGLRAGDIIYGVNRRPVRSVSEFLAALRGTDGSLRISLLRGEYRIALIIR